MPADGAISLAIVDGAPVFRASRAVRGRIDEWLQRQSEAGLSADESRELERFEEVDDYLSLLNRLVRNALWLDRA
jgi:hypothetical protein